MAHPKVSEDIMENNRPALLRIVVDNQLRSVSGSQKTAKTCDQLLLKELESVAVLSEN